VERPSKPRARTGYIPTYLHLPIRRHSHRDHNTPGPLRPWTRLHLISRIVLNHHGSQGSPRISRGRYRCWLPRLGEMLSRIELLVLVRIYNSLRVCKLSVARRYRDDPSYAIVETNRTYIHFYLLQTKIMLDDNILVFK